jgi:phosphomannomutase
LVIFVPNFFNMPIIKSVSGIRGTIGGVPGENLCPPDMVAFATAYATWLKNRFPGELYYGVVIGRDARPSGPLLSQIVSATLNACGIHVWDLGITTTPTVEMAVPAYKAQGGIILTASHNPVEWNALKLLNEKGEFLSAEDGRALLEIVDEEAAEYAPIYGIGQTKNEPDFLKEHIEAILNLPLVDKKAIEKANFRIAIDAVNSSGGIAIPMLLDALGVSDYRNPYGEPTGQFPHNPEPLPENLKTFMEYVKQEHADLGIVVDPDVDRLALVCEDGTFFGEEYTLVAVSDYILQSNPGPVVSNLSSSRALTDIASKYGVHRHVSAVGEVHVVKKMKEVNAVIGGEGNGGIIYPELHYGRDALVGIALFLSYLAKKRIKVSELRSLYPSYAMAKLKADLPKGTDPSEILDKLSLMYGDFPQNHEDGLYLDLGEEWLHLRRSNTEPIIRIYAESKTQENADALAGKAKTAILNLLN